MLTLPEDQADWSLHEKLNPFLNFSTFFLPTKSYWTIHFSVFFKVVIVKRGLPPSSRVWRCPVMVALECPDGKLMISDGHPLSLLFQKPRSNRLTAVGVEAEGPTARTNDWLTGTHRRAFLISAPRLKLNHHLGWKRWPSCVKNSQMIGNRNSD